MKNFMSLRYRGFRARHDLKRGKGSTLISLIRDTRLTDMESGGGS